MQSFFSTMFLMSNLCYIGKHKTAHNFVYCTIFRNFFIRKVKMIMKKYFLAVNSSFIWLIFEKILLYRIFQNNLLLFKKISKHIVFKWICLYLWIRSREISK